MIEGEDMIDISETWINMCEKARKFMPEPELNPVKQLAKAGALIAAEIDRIQQRG